MKFRKLFLLPFASLALLPLVGVGQPTPAPLPLEGLEYNVDSGHSSVLFCVQHAGCSNFWGRFNKVSGSFNFDEAEPANSAIEIEIPTESIDTNSADRDKHLTSPDFFNARQFPKLTFKSSKVAEAEGKGMFEVTGTLSLHGEEQELTFMAEYLGAKEGRMGPKAGFQAEFHFKRTDFGMDTYVEQGMLGDDIRVIVALEADQKK